MADRIRFAPEILSRLGEELVPHPDLGLIELVRNAYDADANVCRIALKNATAPGGTILVEDDGGGMTVADMRDGFLLIGRSAKATRTTTPKLRRKVGEKGLGRLAALRLGRSAEIVTRPSTEPGVANRLRIDWTAFDNARSVDDIELTITTEETTEGQGTTITVTDLREPFTEAHLERLSRALVLLTGPFEDTPDFRATLNAPEFEAVALAVAKPMLGEYEYKLAATVDQAGLASAVLTDWRGTEIARGDHQAVALDRTKYASGVPIRFHCPQAEYELWMFNLSDESFRARNSRRSKPELQDWLQHVGGVHLYHRSLRVHPYGDPGHDWLSMNLRRAASPEQRPSTNTSVGRVLVNDEAQLLIPKTDRSGFVESHSFLELRSFAMRANDWAASERLKLRESRRTAATPTAKEKSKTAEKKLKDVVRRLPPAVRKAVEPAVKDVLETSNERFSAVESDLRLYRMLSTLGTSTAVFAHEVLGPAGRLSSLLYVIQQLIKDEVDGDVYSNQFVEPLDRTMKTADSVQTFARLPLRLLERHKRLEADVDVDEVCRELVELFSAYVKERGIEVTLALEASSATVRTTIADVEAIVANLVTNAAHALLRSEATERSREIAIATRINGRNLELTVDDTGPGIVDMPLDEIWLPGKSSREGGTGLGLTIVKDVVADLRGKYEAAKTGKLGGAHFEISLPCKAKGVGGDARGGR